MRCFLTIFFYLATLPLQGAFAPISSSLQIEAVLQAQSRRPRWDDLLIHLDRPGKIKVLSYSAASGAALGALSGIKTEAVGSVVQKLPEHRGEQALAYGPANVESIYGAAAGAALGGLLGVSHIVFADSEMSNPLREDPKNPYRLRKHLIRLVPRIRTQGISLALNASF